MKNKFLTKAAALVLSLTLGASLAACGEQGGPSSGSGTNGGSGDKTELTILAHAGGPGIDYFNTATSQYGGKSMVQAFEEKYANVSFEPGKTGVTVKISALDNGKPEAIKATISSGNGADVYYTWGRFEQEMASAGIYKNITDLMTEKVYTADGELAEGTYNATTKKYEWTGEQPTVSIVDKMTAHKDDLYLADPTGKLYKEGEGYYSIAYEDSLAGFIVDYDLFVEQGWNDYDGVDGLPDTMEDFFDLIDRILDAGMIPFTTCEETSGYWIPFYNAFLTQYEGAQASAGYTYSGTVTFPKSAFEGSTVDVTAEGMTLSEDGYSVEITPRNAWLLNYLPGVEKCVNFMRDIFTVDNINKEAYNTTYTAGTCQRTFITSKLERGQNDTRIAMIFEGDWWENEARNVFSKNNGGEYGTRDFRMMTIPYIEGQKDSSVRSVATTMDGDNLFVNANSDKYEVARLWLQFTHTETALETYNMLTGLGRSYSYTLSDEQLSQMSKFAQQCYKLRNGKDEYANVTLVYNNYISDGCDYYKNNPLGGFGGEKSFYSSVVSGSGYDQLSAFFRKHTKSDFVTAAEYLAGMKEFNSKKNWETKYDTWAAAQGK